MWRRLILHETGFPRLKFFTSYFIDGRVFFRIFAFYIVFDDLYACINTRKSIREKLHHCQRAKAWCTWRVISIIPQNKPHAHHKTHLHTTSTFVIVDVYMFLMFLLFGNDVISLESRPLILVYLHGFFNFLHRPVGEKPLTPPRKERLKINKIAKFESGRSYRDRFTVQCMLNHQNFFSVGTCCIVDASNMIIS